MIQYRFLHDTSFETLYQACSAAFIDYEVNMQMPFAHFEYRMLRDGVDTSLSVGAFHEQQLVGFYLSSPGSWLGQKTIYDASTGVLPEFRRRGVATEMFRFMLPKLRELGFTQYLLEVLTSNNRALNLYLKLGFKETRKFAVFRSETGLNSGKTAVAEVRRAKMPDWDNYQSFWIGYPSWQNSIEALQRVIDTVVVLEAYRDRRCIGYGVVSRDSGQLFQIAVDRSFRRLGVGSQLLKALESAVATNEFLKVTNVDEQLSDATAFFNALGFKLTLQQFELMQQL